MKKCWLMVAVLPVWLLCSVTANAQDKPADPKQLAKEEKARKKAEEKRQKDELKLLKKMKPEQIKNLKMGFEKANSDLVTSMSQRDSLLRRTADLEARLASQDSLVKSQEDQLQNFQSGKGTGGGRVVSTTNGAGRGAIIPAKGIIFTVQLGAFRNFNISDKMPAKGMSMESNEGMNKYLLGSFKTASQAEAFKKEIQKMGIKDAWVVAFKDGKRIPKEEAAKLLSSNGVDIVE